MAQLVLTELKELGAYVVSKSANRSSYYIKFTNPSLRSLRISDHEGGRKYKYNKWNLRKDVNNSIVEDVGVRYFYSFNKVDSFIRHIKNYANKIESQYERK